MPLLLADQKKIASIILGVQKGDKVEYPESTEDINVDAAYEASAQSIIEAMKKGDAKALVSGLLSFLELYELKEDSMEKEGSEGPQIGI